jgi:hypothetical protein
MDEICVCAPRSERTRRMPAMSSTLTTRSAPATATSAPGRCKDATTQPTPVSISPSSFCSPKFHTRTTPSTNPQVTVCLFAPSVSMELTWPLCAGNFGAFAAAAAASIP